MADELVPIKSNSGTKVNLFRKQARNWKHPDPRLATFIFNCSLSGTPPSRIALMTGCDLRDLKKYYPSELDHGREVAAGELAGNLYDRAMEPDSDPRLVIAANKLIGGLKEKDDKKKTEELKQEEKEVKTTLDITKLSKEQLKQYHYFLSLMQKNDPQPIEGEFTVKEE